MDFNIKKILERKQQQTPEWKDKKICCDVLSDYVNPIHPSDITLTKGMLVLEKIHPTQRTHIKLNKQTILPLLHKRGVYIRDIL